MMATIFTKSIDNFMVIVEEENGVEYVHAKRSDSTTTNKDAHYFPKGDEKGALDFMNSIAALVGVGPIVIVKDNG